MKFDICFPLVIKHEGGFVNHPSDPGGMTNLGVTKAAWEEFLGRTVTEQEMRNLTVDVVKPFYKIKYWNLIRGDDLPPGVDYAVFDFAVNSGVSRASRTLQECVGATKDGQIGDKTIAAVKRLKSADVAQKVCDARLVFLQQLRNFDVFGRGWTKRVIEVSKMCAQMAKL